MAAAGPANYNLFIGCRGRWRGRLGGCGSRGLRRLGYDLFGLDGDLHYHRLDNGHDFFDRRLYFHGLDYHHRFFGRCRFLGLDHHGGLHHHRFRSARLPEAAHQQEITGHDEEEEQGDQDRGPLHHRHKAPAPPGGTLGLGWSGNGKDAGYGERGQLPRPLNGLPQRVQIPPAGLAGVQMMLDGGRSPDGNRYKGEQE